MVGDVEISDEVSLVITSTVKMFHDKRRRSPGEVRKIRERIQEARKQNVPMKVSDLPGHPEEKQYRTAIDKEFTNMRTRGVFRLINSSKMDTS